MHDAVLGGQRSENALHARILGYAGSENVLQVTWKPHDEHGLLSAAERRALPQTAYAFFRQRKEPLVDAQHVRNALARFDQVEGVDDTDRDQAFANILAAARHYGVEVHEHDWRELGHRTRTAGS